MKWLTVVLLFSVYTVCLCVSGRRVRRHLVFTKGSRLFFSVNVRDNLFEYSNFFAHVFGIKMDWDLPDQVVREESKKRRIRRSDIHQGLETALNRYNYNGSSCVRKFVCEASFLLPKTHHFIYQFYEMIFTGGQDTKYSNTTTTESCEEVMKECPISLLSLSYSAQIS